MAPRKKAKEGEGFHFCNGTTAATIAECRTQLKKLSPQEFAQHVNEAKNDIYAWVRDCLDPVLAEKIKYVKNQGKLVELLK